MSKEVRTTSATGGQKGVKAERHDLIPRKAMAAIARVFGFGASKYEDHNWRKGYEWGKSIAALQRHIDSFVDGDTYDEESGLPHLAHAGFHILVLLTWLEEQGEGINNVMDDRWMHAMERVRRAAEAERVHPAPTFDGVSYGPGIMACTAEIPKTGISAKAMSMLMSLPDSALEVGWSDSAIPTREQVIESLQAVGETISHADRLVRYQLQEAVNGGVTATGFTTGPVPPYLKDPDPVVPVEDLGGLTD